MDLNRLIERLQDIRADNPEYASLPVMVRSSRHVSDKRRRHGTRYETSWHTLTFVSSCTLTGLIGEPVIEMAADQYSDWTN